MMQGGDEPACDSSSGSRSCSLVEIEVWERATDGHWHSLSFGPGLVAALEALSARLNVDETWAAARESGV